MFIIVSPAKKLDYDSETPKHKSTEPRFLDQSKKLIKDLKKLSPAEVGKLMKLSENLAQLNYDRFQTFKTPFTAKNARSAMFAFNGDTYTGLDAYTMSDKEINYAQKKLRILSGLYGVIRPLDLIRPYRLEMGTRFSSNGNKDLYEFWKQDITTSLNEELKEDKVLVNLASKEYFSAIDFKTLDADVIVPTFKEKKGDTFKVVGFYAKRARGAMARYIIDNQITSPQDLKDFDWDGYQFNAELSKNNEWVFTR